MRRRTRLLWTNLTHFSWATLRGTATNKWISSSLIQLGLWKPLQRVEQMTGFRSVPKNKSPNLQAAAGNFSKSRLPDIEWPLDGVDVAANNSNQSVGDDAISGSTGPRVHQRKCEICKLKLFHPTKRFNFEQKCKWLEGWGVTWPGLWLICGRRTQRTTLETLGHYRYRSFERKKKSFGSHLWFNFPARLGSTFHSFRSQIDRPAAVRWCRLQWVSDDFEDASQLCTAVHLALAWNVKLRRSGH